MYSISSPQCAGICALPVRAAPNEMPLQPLLVGHRFVVEAAAHADLVGAHRVDVVRLDDDGRVRTRVPMLIVQPTEQELQVVLVQSSVRAIHLFGFSISVAVGQTSMQAPQKSQFDSWIGPPAPNAMRVV